MSAYLDHAATTPVRKAALDAYLEAQSHLGNPSSVHAQGRETREILEHAREQLANAIGCHRSEVIFTSGGTESDNHLIKGIFWARQQDRDRKLIISAMVEHHAVIDPIEWLERHEGAEAIWLEVDKSGQVDQQQLIELVNTRGDEIALISLMWVNNETGALFDIPALAEIANQASIPMHSDAVAAFGHTPIRFSDSGLSAMTISGHKLGAPIGIGASIVARSQKPVSLIHGGGQERSLRSGTMNYPMAAAFAAAATEAVADMDAREKQLEIWRNELESAVLSEVPQAIRTISGPRIGHTASFIFQGAMSDSLLFLLDQQGVCVSAGSACQAGVLGPSHVMTALGYSDSEASAVMRVSLGHTTTKNEVDELAKAIGLAYSTAVRAGLNR